MSPLKGQYLFVRPVGEGDEASLRALYEADGASLPEPLIAPLALLGKLAGTVVGHAVAAPDSSVLRITHFYVARELRGMRIGRGLLGRLEELAGRMQYTVLIADLDSACGGFLAREGFSESGGRLERMVRIVPEMVP